MLDNREHCPSHGGFLARKSSRSLGDVHCFKGFLAHIHRRGQPYPSSSTHKVCLHIVPSQAKRSHTLLSFFTQLVDALGVSDFLSPVCMLLVDKVANRVARQSAADAQNSLFLPLSILERYPPELRLQVTIVSSSLI